MPVQGCGLCAVGGSVPTPALSCSSPLRRARALYACKAEHDSELSFTAGTVFDNGECWALPRPQPSLSPGQLQPAGTLQSPPLAPDPSSGFKGDPGELCLAPPCLPCTEPFPEGCCQGEVRFWVSAPGMLL